MNIDLSKLKTAEDKLKSLRDTLISDIKAERDRRTQQGGYSVDTEQGKKWFHSDTFSRSQQLGLLTLGVNIPTNLSWKTMDGSFVLMTPELAGLVFSAATLSDVSVFAHAEALINQVKTAEDPQSVDIKVGWPVCFTDLDL